MDAFLLDRSNSTLNNSKNNNNNDNIQAQGMDDVNGVLFNVLLIVFKLVLYPVLVIIGVCTNVINIAVFYRMGLSDGVTLNFFILSISDCLLATIGFVSCMSYISLIIIRAYVGYGDSEIKAQVLYWATYLAGLIPQYISIITTVVIATVRCCCVVIPLKVKYLITRRRQLVLILILSGISTSTLLYIFAGTYTIYVYDPLTNRSVAHSGAQWSLLNGVNNAAYCGSFGVVIMCVIILSVSLDKASKFRGSSTAGASTPSDNKDRGEGKSMESQRDVRVIRTVVIVSVVFIVGNTPSIVYLVVKTLIEGLTPSGKFKNANQIFLMVNETFTILNLTLNMFIYVLYNTRYRTTLLTMVGKNKTRGKRSA